MSRLFYGMMFAFGLSLCSFTVGCGDGGPTVIEQDPADVAAETESYEQEMEEEAKRAEAEPIE